MPAFNFHAQFAGKVERGEKLHTIRAKRKNPPKVGQSFYGFTGMRTMQCRRLVSSTITKVDAIEILSGQFVQLNGRHLTASEIDKLARADGFDGADSFFKFFDAVLPFRGDLIHWAKV